MPLLQRCVNDVSLADAVVQLRRQVDILTQYLADLQPVASDTDSNVDDPDHRFVLSSPYTYDTDHENDEFHDELSPCIPVDISPVFDEYPVELDGDDEYYSFLPRYDDESVSYEDHIKGDGDDDASYSSPPVYDEESMFFEGLFELDDKDATIDSCLQVLGRLFNGMMDPEMIRMAQEQMSRMSPAEFARIQQMLSNPEFMRMATEGMQNLRTEDFKNAAEQLKHTRPEDMAEIGEKMANASPEELPAMRARMDAQVSYEINAAAMLKTQGNELHSQGKYKTALVKYMRAKNNLKDIPTSKGRNLLLACSLNMMSCYLKTKEYEECIREGTEVLAYDAMNIKALYRRGLAYKEFGKLGEAVSDLRKAHEVSPGDETIADILRDAEEKLNKEGGGGHSKSRGVVIEEITEEATVSSDNCESSRSKSSILSPQETDQSKTSRSANIVEPQLNHDYFKALKDDPESIRSFQNFISRTDPETLAAMNGGKVEGISPDMLKTATDMFGKMSPEELNRMFQVASSFQGQKNGASHTSAPTPADLSPDMLKTATDMMAKMSPKDLQKMFDMASPMKGNGASSSSVPPNMTPDMIKMATDMMNNMPAEERQKMFEMASSLGGQERPSSTATSYSNGLRSDEHKTRDNLKVNGSDAGESSSSQHFNSSSPQSSFLNSSGDLQEQMRNQMKDPAMRQMLTSMMKNMNPEMMANMGEQFGFKLSREDAERAQQAMSSLSPDTLDTMMKWADRVQRGVEGARKTKNWLLGRPGMILAILMLLLAVVLHWFGFVGK